MNTNDNCGMATFKWLATLLSFAIALPGYFDSSSKIAFILTACVFSFGKFVENIEGITRHKTIFHTFFCVLGSIFGAVAIGFCFYYFAAISNVTNIVEVSEVKTAIETEVAVGEELQTETGSVQLFSDSDMSKYPLFKGEFLYVLLFCVLVYFIIQETIFCGCEFCKYIITKKKILLSAKTSNQLLDISIE